MVVRVELAACRRSAGGDEASEAQAHQARGEKTTLVVAKVEKTSAEAGSTA